MKHLGEELVLQFCSDRSSQDESGAMWVPMCDILCDYVTLCVTAFSSLTSLAWNTSIITYVDRILCV